MIANSSLICTSNATSLNLWTNLYNGFPLACFIIYVLLLAIYWKLSINSSCNYFEEETNLDLRPVIQQNPSCCNVTKKNLHMSAPSRAYNMSLLLKSISCSIGSNATLSYFGRLGCMNSLLWGAFVMSSKKGRLSR